MGFSFGGKLAGGSHPTVPLRKIPLSADVNEPRRKSRILAISTTATMGSTDYEDLDRSVRRHLEMQDPAGATTCPASELPGALLVRPGDTVGRFRIEYLLGRGGMGVVYAARDLTLGRRVALKLLTGGQLYDDSHEQHLLREARATALVSHPNLATLFDIGQANGSVFIAMELVEGHTLRVLLDTSQAPLVDALRIASEIAHGLAAIHEAGLVHRDIKPENVMVAKNGTIKILDFGLAKLGDGTGRKEAATSTEAMILAPRWVGTPGYMSPEQARGAPIDGSSDVFSLGVILYEMLAGERPFRGATVMDVLAAIVRDDPPPLPSLPHHRGARLVGIVERCLQKDPRNRYSHGGELARALDEAEDPATSVQAIARSGVPQGATEGVPATPQRRRWLTVTAISATVLILGVFAQRWFLLARAAPERAEPRSRVALAAPTPPPRTGSMVDLPLPASTSTAAIIAYKSAIQSFHDSNWGQAEFSLREALSHDPTMGIAHLRLALIVSYLDYTAAEAKASYREAMRLRSSLSPRDRGLLVALEPLLNADPVDLGETERRFSELTERYPLDAELFNLLGIYRRWEGPEGQLDAAERALAIDPDYPDAWAAVAEASVDRDRAASIAALDRCLSIAPTASDCRMLRAILESGVGRCVQAEEHIRRATDDPHASECMFLLRARFLYALGEPHEAVGDAFRQRWARLPASSAQEEALHDGALLAAAYGDFERAKRKAEEGLQLIDTQATLRAHARFALLLTDIELETGRTAAAAAVASSFLMRRKAWQRGLLTDDPSVYLTRVVARAGGLSDRQVQAERETWYQGATGSVALKRVQQQNVWRLAYVQGIERSDEALEALAVRPKGEGSVLDGAFDEALGQALWLSGKVNEALPYLARAHHRCDRLASIISAIRSDMRYANALEKRGDRTSACGTYRSILRRWANAKPRSVTADAARDRSTALGCGDQTD